MISITILIDNYIKVQDLVAEHGLSYLIEADGKKILFDTGQSRNFMDNAASMGLDLKEIDCIAISHGHYDHTGGLSDLLDHIDKEINIYAHPGIFDEKFVKISDVSEKDNYRYIGVPYKKEDLEQKKAKFVFQKNAVELAEDVFLIGEIEDTINTNNFFIKKEGFYSSDRLLDDNSIFIQAKDASILLLGCAHSGILNILQKVESEYNIDTGLVIIGGLHLVGLNRSSIKEIADKIDKYDIKKIIPCHCTGITGYEVLKEVFGQRCVMGEVSKVFISD